MKGTDEVQGWRVSPQLVIPLPIWHKLMAYAALCPAEINGYGMVEWRDGLLVVEDVFITRQVVTGGSADVARQDNHELLYRLTAAGIDTGKLRLQWHSHVDMAAYFSIVDTANIEAYNSEWMASLVINRRGEFGSRLDVFQPFRFGGTIPTVIGMPSVTPDTVEACREDILQHVAVAGRVFTRRARPETVSTVEGGAIPVMSTYPEGGS